MDHIEYTIRIKKEYAASMIEDLKQVDAIEILQESIPTWQQEESVKRLADMKSNPSAAIAEETFFKALEE